MKFIVGYFERVLTGCLPFAGFLAERSGRCHLPGTIRHDQTSMKKFNDRGCEKAAWISCNPPSRTLGRWRKRWNANQLDNAMITSHNSVLSSVSRLQTDSRQEIPEIIPTKFEKVGPSICTLILMVPSPGLLSPSRKVLYSLCRAGFSDVCTATG
jgi:hypothetical protein